LKKGGKLEVIGMLSDITVLDFTRNLAGPFCTMTLGDMGANVMKVEIPPYGDDTRKIGPFIRGESTYFLSINRSKRGITLNLKSEEGKGIVHRLIEKADVIVENNRPGVMKRLGLSYEDTKAIKPEIIYASISGFGQYGPHKDKGAYDMVVQGYGGVMSITGEEDGEPVRVGYSVGDLGAALYTVIAILGALHVYKATGKGQHLDISMMDCQVALLENAVVRYTMTGKIAKPLGSRHPVCAPFQAYKARDRFFIVAIGNDRLFRTFCEALNLEELCEDKRFSENDSRVANIEELNGLLGGLFKEKDRSHWIALLEKAGIPCGPINNVEEVVNSPQTKAREMIVEVDHPLAGKIRLSGSPIKSSLTPVSVERAAPTVGQDTETILKEVGYSESEIAFFKGRGVI
jgi:CoA:oxalate CoA-transferase